MSDSHVNDIRYTALWRPLIKPRANHLLPASFFRLLRQSLYIEAYTWNLVEARWNSGDYWPELVETWTGFSGEMDKILRSALLWISHKWDRIFKNLLKKYPVFKLHMTLENWFYFDNEILFKFIVVLKISIFFLEQNKYNISMRLTFY